MSRGATPASSASAAVTPRPVSTRSCVNDVALAPNSSSTARTNSLRLMRVGRRSVQRQLGLDGGDEVIRDHVREAAQALDHRDAVTDFTHDRRDGDVKGIGHRGQDLAGGLLLAPLHLTEVAERDGRLARDLAEGPTPLQAEVPQDIADLLSYKDHRNLLSVVSL